MTRKRHNKTKPGYPKFASDSDLRIVDEWFTSTKSSLERNWPFARSMTKKYNQISQRVLKLEKWGIRLRDGDPALQPILAEVQQLVHDFETKLAMQLLSK